MHCQMEFCSRPAKLKGWCYSHHRQLTGYVSRPVNPLVRCAYIGAHRCEAVIRAGVMLCPEHKLEVMRKKRYA